MNKRISILLAGLTALLCSCGDDTVENSDFLKPNAKSRLYVTVLDNSDGSLVGGATLNLQSAGKTTTTSAQGVAVFEDLDVGTHLLRVNHNDYATVIKETDVSEVDAVTAGDKANQSVVRLYPKGATIEGYIYHKTSDGKITAAAGVPLRITFGCDIAEVAETTTGPNGRFTFEKMPIADCDYYIETTGGTIDGKAYGALRLFYNFSLKKGSNNIGSKSLGDGVNIFTLLGYDKEVSSETAPLVFTFSENIAANQQSKVTISGGSGAAFNVKIEGSVVTLTPVTSWGQNFVDVDVDFTDLKSESGKTFSTTATVGVPTDISEAAITGLQFNPGETFGYYENGVYRTIKFNKVEGATGYNYYLREQNGNLWTLGNSSGTVVTSSNVVIATVKILFHDSLSATNPTLHARLGDTKNQLIVRAYNSRYESLPDSLEIKETKTEAPTFANGNGYICEPEFVKGVLVDPYTSGNHCGIQNQNQTDILGGIFTGDNLDGIVDAFRSAAQSATEYYSDNIYFSRSMQTDYAAGDISFVQCSPTPTADASSCGRFQSGISLEWLNNQVLRIKVKLAAGAAAVADGKLVGIDAISIQGLKGVNGVLFDNGETPGTPDNDLKINFSGTTSSVCSINPFADATCTASNKVTFCEKSKNYEATVACKTLFPTPCSSSAAEGVLSGLAGSPTCPDGLI